MAQRLRWMVAVWLAPSCRYDIYENKNQDDELRSDREVCVCSMKSAFGRVYLRVLVAKSMWVLPP